MSIAAKGVPNPTAIVADLRAHKRHAVHVEATLHARGGSQPTVINDLSAGGAGLSTTIGIFANDEIVLELPDGRRLPATVAWVLSGCCGLTFTKPLDAGDALFPKPGRD